MSVKPPPSVTAQSGYNRFSASLSAPERSQGAPQPLLAPLWFELPDFALKIIDAGLCIRQLTLVIFHFLAELLMPRIQVFVVGFKVAQPLLVVLTSGLIHLVLQDRKSV